MLAADRLGPRQTATWERRLQGSRRQRTRCWAGPCEALQLGRGDTDTECFPLGLVREGGEAVIELSRGHRADQDTGRDLSSTTPTVRPIETGTDTLSANTALPCNDN